jgi:hypothetical protein
MVSSAESLELPVKSHFQQVGVGAYPGRVEFCSKRRFSCRSVDRAEVPEKSKRNALDRAAESTAAVWTCPSLHKCGMAPTVPPEE